MKVCIVNEIFADMKVCVVDRVIADFEVEVVDEIFAERKIAIVDPIFAEARVCFVANPLSCGGGGGGPRPKPLLSSPWCYIAEGVRWVLLPVLAISFLLLVFAGIALVLQVLTGNFTDIYKPIAACGLWTLGYWLARESWLTRSMWF